MNDTTNPTTADAIDDDIVIARLRSALDEVAGTATPAANDDESRSPVITLRSASPGRRPTRTWIGVAAASVVLLGAAGWALTQRSTPSATGDSSTVPSSAITSTPTGSTPTNIDDSPWYALNLPDAVPGGLTTTSTDAGLSGFTQYWVITDPSATPSIGVLMIDVRYEPTGLSLAENGYTQLESAPQGTAWLRSAPAGSGGETAAMVWQRDDGTEWWVNETGLLGSADTTGAAFTDYVFQVERGTFNDLLSNPDPRAEWVGAVPANGRVQHAQDYSVGGIDAGVVLGVGAEPQFATLAGAADIAESTVASSRAWRGTQANGDVTLVWLIDSATIAATNTTPQQWWGSARISQALAGRVDEVIAAITPAPTQPAVTVTTQIIPTITTTPAASASKPADAPSYVLDGLTPESNGSAQVGNGDALPRSAVWVVDQTSLGAPTAYVFATAMDWGGVPYDVDGVNYLDVSRNGVTAVLDTGASAATDVPEPKVYMPQADGVVWVFEAANLTPVGSDPYAALVDIAFSLGSDAFGSGVGSTPPLPTTLLGDGPWPSYEYFDNYTTAGAGAVKVAVSDGFAANALRDVAMLSATTVAGRPALMGTLPDGSVLVVWQAAEGSAWWASLTFAGASAAAIDQVIASMQPA